MIAVVARMPMIVGTQERVHPNRAKIFCAGNDLSIQGQGYPDQTECS